MINKLIIFIAIAGLISISSVFADENIKSLVLKDGNGKDCDVVKESFKQPIILVRYLGATCSKCLHQLNILNSLTDKLKENNTKVIGFSNDDAQQNKKILQQAKYENSAVNLFSDNDSKASTKLGATIVELTGEKTELHATFLIYKGEILFSNIDAKPYMFVNNLFEIIASLK
ncbi:MAG: hypothetical protein CVV22_06685 [Ignavibacteriae bacterium HGW-Ignavibacteriae-1]|jgi:peroxiredoxin|nr:MAG: hypothetical protein CVV22_06685 [Ignavibacteriae bacterium HGW-Ignavibacteriae-1]